MRKKYLFIIVLVITYSFTYAQQHPSELGNRVNKLEVKSEFQDSKIDEKANKETVESHKRDIESKNREIEDKIEDLKSTNLWTLVNILIVIFGLFGISLWSVKSYIVKKFTKLVDDKEQQILRIIEEKDAELTIKTKQQIRVLLSEETDISFLQFILKHLGYKNLSYESLKDNTQRKNQTGNEYDLLFIYRNGLTDTEIKHIIANETEEKVVFIFGDHVQFTPDERVKYIKRLSFANIWSQLEGNLMSALKYQKEYKEKLNNS